MNENYLCLSEISPEQYIEIKETHARHERWIREIAEKVGVALSEDF